MNYSIILDKTFAKEVKRRKAERDSISSHEIELLLKENDIQL